MIDGEFQILTLDAAIGRKTLTPIFILGFPAMANPFELYTRDPGFQLRTAAGHNRLEVDFILITLGIFFITYLKNDGMIAFATRCSDMFKAGSILK